ncbi:Unknown protein, partial [Striga hermonthica]
QSLSTLCCRSTQSACPLVPWVPSFRPSAISSTSYPTVLHPLLTSSSSLHLLCPLLPRTRPTTMTRLLSL